MTPVLSVVIPAFNVERFIAAAVHSALAQTFTDLEVIVVDDGSTDHTADVVSAIDDPRVRLIQQQNAGLAGARNTGIRAARGAYLGLLDGDDVWMPEKAALQIRLLQKEPSLTLTYSYSAYLNEDGTPTGNLLMTKPQRPTLSQMIAHNHVGNGSTPIGRTADFIAAGLFDERLRTALEDYELWPRLMRRTGRGLALVPQILTGYRVRNGSLSMGIENFLRHAELSRRLMAENHSDMPAWLLDRGLAGHYRIAARKAAGQGGLPLRLLLHAARLAPWLPLTEPRFMGTLALTMLGGRGQNQMYRILRNFTRARPAT